MKDVARARSPLTAELRPFCRDFLLMTENFSYDFDDNGEAWLLRTIATMKPKVIFDVGANRGEWSRVASTVCGEANIHAFEIVPHTYGALETALGHC